MPKKRISRRKERRITVSYIYRDYYDDRFWTGSRKFPVLRFGGEWLAQAGLRGRTARARASGPETDRDRAGVVSVTA